MTSDPFILVLVVAAIVIGTMALSRFIGHFKFGDHLAARIAEYKIQNASADDALSDPQLRALISCPQCRAAGDFDVIGKKHCKCRQCGNQWDVR